MASVRGGRSGAVPGAGAGPGGAGRAGAGPGGWPGGPRAGSGLRAGPGGWWCRPRPGGRGGLGGAGLAQHGGDGGCVVGAEVEELDSLQPGAGRGDAGDDAVGGDLAGDSRRPGTQQDRGGARPAACFQDAAQPRRGGGIAGSDQRGPRLRTTGGGAVWLAAVAGGAGRAGLAQDHGFHLIERRGQRGGH